MADDVELLPDWLDSFFEFFEWLYQIELAEGARSRVELELRRGWSNTDDSEVVFFARVLRAEDKVKASAAKDLITMRTKARENLKEEFADTALTDKCRVLAALHNAIEKASPGCTGVAAARRLRRPDPTRPVAGTMAQRIPARTEPPGRSRYDAPLNSIARVSPAQAVRRAAAPEIGIPPGPPGKAPIPPLPNLLGLDTIGIAQALAQHWDNVQRVHMLNGDDFAAQRAMQNHKNYMSMAIAIGEKENDIISKIWR
jgi:hypothetical protein